MARIMVAEFNHLIPGMIKKCLQPIGHEVYTASHGEAAIEVWKQAQADLLMTGIMLPGIDGYELIRQWKAEWGAAKPAIIIAGKSGQPVDTQLASQIGVDAVLNYPFKSADVVEIVDRVLDAVSTGSLAPRPDATPRPAPAPRPAGPTPPTGPRPVASPKAPPAATLLRSLKDELAVEGLLDTAGTPRPVSVPAARSAPAVAHIPAPQGVSAGVGRAGAAPSAALHGAPGTVLSAPLQGRRAETASGPGVAGHPGAASSALRAVPPLSPSARPGDPAAQLREMLNAKFQEVTDAIIRSLPAIVEKIVDEKLGRR